MRLASPWFGLGILSVAILIATVEAADSPAEARAISLVEKAGGRVSRDARKTDNPVVGVDFSDAKITDAALKELANLPQLTRVSLDRTAIADGGVKYLAPPQGPKGHQPGSNEDQRQCPERTGRTEGFAEAHPGWHGRHRCGGEAPGWAIRIAALEPGRHGRYRHGSQEPDRVECAERPEPGEDRGDGRGAEGSGQAARVADAQRG